MVKKGSEFVSQAASNVIAWVRGARQNGSDVIVELDTASMFGRGQIEPVLERAFDTAVMKLVQFTRFGADQKLALSTGAGATLTWKQNPFYRELYSSIVQLSFLGWIHDRTALAASLNVCMDNRFDNQLSPVKSPGFDGIFPFLESVSSETSGFKWSQLVERHARSSMQW